MDFSDCGEVQISLKYRRRARTLAGRERFGPTKGSDLAWPGNVENELYEALEAETKCIVFSRVPVQEYGPFGGFPHSPEAQFHAYLVEFRDWWKRTSTYLLTYST